MFDYLVIGAGFSGAVIAERLATQLDQKVLVVDRRPHVGGNAYDHFDDEGVLVHKYGPHIFHTNCEKIFAYLSQFTSWRPYEHRVLAEVDGALVPFPINVTTINRLFRNAWGPADVERFFAQVAEPVSRCKTSEDVVVAKIGRELYEKFFRNYTRKQWGLDPSELDASVAARVPARLDYDDRYFTDRFQAMPLHGYTRLFQNMLRHPNIKLMLQTDFREIKKYVRYRQTIYTGPIDEYYDHCFGKLPYRTIEFAFESHDREQFQRAAVINYPNDHRYTRVTEFKWLTGQRHPKTSVVYEFPKSTGDPYYPIPRPQNAELYKRYKERADREANVRFVGRLATYKYYNMDQCIGQALAVFEQIRAGQQESGSQISAA